MAMQVGSLYVSLSANTSGLIKGFAQAAKATERLAKEVKKTSNDIAQGAAAFTAIGAAAMKLAASVDGQAKRSMDGLEKSMKLVAVQVADIVRPAVDALAKSFRTLAGYVAGLDPETKKSIATFATWAAGIAVGAKAVGTIAGLLSTLAGIVSGVGGVIAAIGTGPILLLVAGLAAAAAGIAALHYAFRTNLGGIADMWKRFANWFSSSAANIFDGAAKFISEWADRFLSGLREMAAGVAIIQDKLGNRSSANAWKGLALSIEMQRKNLVRDGLQGLVTEALDLGKQAGAAFIDEWKRILQETGISGLLPNFKAGSARLPSMGGGAAAPGDRSGHGFMADESLRLHAQRSANALREITTEANAFKQAMRNVTAELDVRKWLRELEAAPTVTMKNGLATSSLSDPRARGGRFGAGMQISTEGNKAAAAMKTFADKAKAVAGIALSGLGALGQTIGSIAQGAQAGGVWGAIIAAVMAIFQRMESFQRLMEILEYGLKRLGEFLEPLLGPIFEVVESLTVVGTEILAPMFDALRPLFEGIAKFARGLIPVVHGVGYIFEAVAPILEVLANIIGPIFEALKPVLDIVTAIIKMIATVLLGVLIGLNELAAAFGDEKAKAEAARLKGLVDKMWGPAANELAIGETEAARAAWRNAGAQNEAAESAQKVAESLSNVPSGYRVALARYNADLGITAGSGYAMAGAAGGGSFTVNGDVNVTTDAEEAAALAEDIQEETRRRRGQSGGNPRGGGRGGDW